MISHQDESYRFIITKIVQVNIENYIEGSSDK